MLTVSSLSIHFGGNYLFDDVSFMIAPRDRVGLVGKNGAGKSTLLKILSGLLEEERGSVHKSNGLTIGYLPQDIISAGGRTVYDETATAFAETLALEERIHAISDELERRTDYESDEYNDLLHELSDVNDHLTRMDSGSMRGQIERILTGLGFEQRDMTKMTEELSGGWQMRIELAKILLRKPDYILLDEPTNHLDIESLMWLEEFLKNYDGAIVMISHDRSFLDSITTRTLEITLGKVHDYPASYSKYVQMRQERREQQLAAFTNQQKQIADTEKFIERFRYKATKAVQVQSRIKQLDKIDRIEIEEEDTASVHFRFPDAPRSGRTVFEAQGVVKSFGEKTILRGIDFAIERGEKIAFVGKNGEGKTTFAKMLVGQEEVSGGVITIGHNVAIGYYAQHQAEMLDPNATVLDIIDRAATGEMRTKIRDLLGAFLFSGDSVYKKVKVLSGGEKSRLAMAKLLLEPINALILDEPTNHLDMRSKDVLKQALMDYDGALIVVSHDRDFLQGLTGKVVEFRGGAIKEFAGDIYEFLRIKNIETLRQLEKSTKEPNTPQPASHEPPQAPLQAPQQTPLQAPQQTPVQTTSKPEPINQNLEPIASATTSPLDREERKRLQKEERRLARLIEDCEKQISALETSIGAIEQQMAEAEFYTKPNFKDVIAEVESQRKALDTTMEEWAKLSAEREEILLTMGVV
ncbi:MAG: ATP-binding cassette domain-containing protein [Candidatus Kapabacteria bacterium]|jgi:ATP-binding cassette subfamily F protein 3|nr:ATP-binding cassette domain-containing protein [Candidatus Kapabacteria bacterium]